MKRYSKDVIKGVERLGFDYMWTNAQGFLCYVHPNDPDQTELSISPSISDEHTARTLLRLAEKRAAVAPHIEKRRASRVKERAEAARDRAREQVRLAQERQARLLARQGSSAAEVERVRRLVELRERELAAHERLMQQPPAGGSVHRGTGQVRHFSGGRR